jgi:hypothetical protein
MPAGAALITQGLAPRICGAFGLAYVFPPSGLCTTENGAVSGILRDHGGREDEDALLVWTFVFSIAARFALSAVAPVAAADVNPVYKAPAPAIAPFNWNGFYVGANVGGAWASNTVNQSNLVKSGDRDFNVTSSGVVGGGQFGYNRVAAPNGLLGVEADVSGADLNGGPYGRRAHTGGTDGRAGNQPDPDAVTNPDSGVKFNEKIDAFGTVRGRVGYVKQLVVLRQRRIGNGVGQMRQYQFADPREGSL